MCLWIEDRCLHICSIRCLGMFMKGDCVTSGFDKTHLHVGITLHRLQKWETWMLLQRVQEYTVINTLWTSFLQWTPWILTGETTYTAFIHDFFAVPTKRNKNGNMLVVLSESVLEDSFTPFLLRPRYSISRKMSMETVCGTTLGSLQNRPSSLLFMNNNLLEA